MPLTAEEIADRLADAMQELLEAQSDYAAKAMEIEYDAEYFLHREGSRIGKAKAALADVLVDLKQWTLEL